MGKKMEGEHARSDNQTENSKAPHQMKDSSTTSSGSDGGIQLPTTPATEGPSETDESVSRSGSSAHEGGHCLCIPDVCGCQICGCCERIEFCDCGGHTCGDCCRGGDCPRIVGRGSHDVDQRHPSVVPSGKMSGLGRGRYRNRAQLESNTANTANTTSTGPATISSPSRNAEPSRRFSGVNFSWLRLTESPRDSDNSKPLSRSSSSHGQRPAVNARIFKRRGLTPHETAMISQLNAMRKEIQATIERFGQIDRHVALLVANVEVQAAAAASSGSDSGSSASSPICKTPHEDSSDHQEDLLLDATVNASMPKEASTSVTPQSLVCKKSIVDLH